MSKLAPPITSSTNPFASANPFLSAGGAFDAPEITGNFTYQMIKSGPDVDPSEVEVAHASSIEVQVMWDTNVLHVAALGDKKKKGFDVGEDAGCGFFVPREVLGATHAPIVTSRGTLVILPRTTGWLEVPGRGKTSLADLVSRGEARSSDEMSGAYEVSIPAGGRARMELEAGIAFQVSVGNAGKAPPVGAFSSFEPGAYLFSGLSFLLHTGMLASLAFFMPSLGADEDEAIGRDQILIMQHMLQASAERENEQRDTPDSADNSSTEGGTGTKSKGEEGTAGASTSQATNKRFGVQGPRDNPDPHLARIAALREAAEFGMIGLLNAGGGADPNAPTSPWGRQDSSGTDPMSAKGNMWGDAIGEAFGLGGLGLVGTGEGGGGTGEGSIGMGNINTIGHGNGTGGGDGFGRGNGHVGGSHHVKSPSLSQGTTTVNGRLPPEVIQRIVRQNFGRFKLCYTEGLRDNPSLQGRVSVKFVISRDGSVGTSADGGSDLPNQSVTQCVVRGFGNLSFPVPEGGIVTVVYPLIFSPGEV